MPDHGSYGRGRALVRKTATDAVTKYNEMAMAAPDYVWSRRFAHPRMEDAAGSGRITLEYQEGLVGGSLTDVEAVRTHINTTQAYDELSRLCRRIRRAGRKRQREGK